MKKPKLTPRDRQLLEMLAQGMSTAAIAKAMKYTPGTIRVYLHVMYQRLGVASAREAVALFTAQHEIVHREVMRRTLVDALTELQAWCYTNVPYYPHGKDDVAMDARVERALKAYRD